jgi:hypothetical protein
MTSLPLIERRSLAVQTADLGKRFGTRAVAWAAAALALGAWRTSTREI